MNAPRIVSSGRRFDNLCQPQARRHANAQRRFEQIYDVDPIEAPTELKRLRAFLIQELLVAPADAARPHGVGLPATRRHAAACSSLQLAVPPMARLRLLTRHDASTVCVTVLTHHFLWATQRMRRLGSLVRRACRCVERKRVTQTAASREPAIVSEALLRATK